MKTSKLLIESSLLPYHAASNVMRQLGELAPTLHQWIQYNAASVSEFDPFDYGCTTLEHTVLNDLGFKAPTGVPLGAGLVHLLNTSNSSQWIIHLGSTHIGSQNIQYINGADINISLSESEELLNCSQPYFKEHDFNVTLLSPVLWAIQGDLPSHHGSIDMILDEGIEHCWPKTNEAKLWRRLVNELQMVWHKHPVNQSRQSQGLPEINTLWVEGGSQAWTPKSKQFVGTQGLAKLLSEKSPSYNPDNALNAPLGLPNEYIIRQDLTDAYRKNNWAHWTEILQELEKTTFLPLNQALNQGRIEQLDVVLFSPRLKAELNIKSRSKFLRWLPQQKHDWRAWWLNHD